MTEYLTVKEIAESLRVKRNTVYLWISLRKFASYKFGCHVRISKDEFDEWVEKQRREKSKFYD